MKWHKPSPNNCIWLSPFCVMNKPLLVSAKYFIASVGCDEFCWQKPFYNLSHPTYSVLYYFNPKSQWQLNKAWVLTKWNLPWTDLTDANIMTGWTLTLYYQIINIKSWAQSHLIQSTSYGRIHLGEEFRTNIPSDAQCQAEATKASPGGKKVLLQLFCSLKVVFYVYIIKRLILETSRKPSYCLSCTLRICCSSFDRITKNTKYSKSIIESIISNLIPFPFLITYVMSL